MVQNTVYLYSMRRLSDVIPNFEIHAVCLNCQRMVSLNTEELVTRLGSDYPVSRIRQQVRCRSCQRKTEDIRLVYVGNRGTSRGFHYRQ